MSFDDYVNQHGIQKEFSILSFLVLTGSFFVYWFRFYTDDDDY